MNEWLLAYLGGAGVSAVLFGWMNERDGGQGDITIPLAALFWPVIVLCVLGTVLASYMDDESRPL